MSSAGYYRKQAEVCARLAGTAGSMGEAARFNALALDLLLKAADAEQKCPNVVRSQSSRPGGDRNAA
jgi:hypothetical protein